MMPSSRLIGIGAFVIGGLVLFATALFMIGDRRMMFKEQFDVYADFADIAGLQHGAMVRVRGMEAGEVTDIGVPATPTGRFRVRMRIREDLWPLVRTDSSASIQTDGLVGNRVVKIDAGSEQAPVVADGGEIKGQEPFDFGDLLQRAGVAVEEVGRMVTEVRGDFERAIATIDQTATTAHDMIKALEPDIVAMSNAGRRISEDTSRMLAGVREGRGTVGKLMNDDEMYARMSRITQDAEQVVRLTREAVSDARAALAGVQGGLKSDQGPMRAVVDDLRGTLASTRSAMSDLAENTEALKRNLLFRGFFEDRGYYDLNDLTPADYREGALAGKYRQPIRIWLRADKLLAPVGPSASATTPGGVAAPRTVESLSNDGRARLDQAMAELLRYPRNSPLIIEGYALADTRDERFLRAAERARQVRDYVVAKYGVSPNHVATMPLGNEATGSPDGNQWDGVALALWVDRRAFDRSPPSKGR
jgi:phospholipid/cholesterol/gamma-HCH transport system substrate-binding protein